MEQKIELSPEAREAMRAYNRKYYKENAEKVNARQAAWKRAHPDKVRAYRAKHWETMAKKMAAENNEQKEN